MLLIDPEECIDCGACERVCPVEAIFVDDEVPDEYEMFISLNAAVSGSPETVDALIDEVAEAQKLGSRPLHADEEAN